MPSFSERNGYVKNLVQHEAMDQRLVNALWSVVHDLIEEVRAHWLHRKLSDRYVDNMRITWVEFFGGARDQINYTNALTSLRAAFYRLTWNQVYDFVEYFAKSTLWTTSDLVKAFNVALEREHSAYRVSDDGNVIEVTDKGQLAAINLATEDTSGLPSVHKHLASAQACYSQRDESGYRNCIKESISAVETLVGLILEDTPTLGEGLSKLGKTKLGLHPGLREAWKKIYGYASERPGVRHGSAGEAESDGPVTSGEALFMLVSCSAFATYVIELAANANIKLA